MFSDFFRKKSAGPQENADATSRPDPFSKTSFEALLETLDAFNPPEFDEGRAKQDKVFDKDSFPGFTSAPLSLATDARMKMEQSFSQTELKGGLPNLRQRSAGLSLSSPPMGCPRECRDGPQQHTSNNKRPTTSGNEDYPVLRSYDNAGQASAFPRMQSNGICSPGSNLSSPMGSYMDIPQRKRLSSSGGLSSGGRIVSPRGSPTASPTASAIWPRPPDGDVAAVESNVWQPASELGEALIVLPRVSIESLGGFSRAPEVQQWHCSVESSGAACGYSSGGGVSGKGQSKDRREKNRVAQRRFRDRQKETVSSLQTELDAKEAVNECMAMQIRVLEQTNNALTAKLKEYERSYGPVSSPAGQQS